MKTWIKVLLGITLSFMCLFTCVGYASVTSNMYISGDVEVSPPKAIFIYDIRNVQTSGATIVTTPVNIGFPSTKVMSEITFSKRNSYVTFEVAIKNLTEFSQYFDMLEEYSEMEGVSGSFSYASVDWTVVPSQGTEIKAGENLTFTVTLKYVGTNTNQTRKMLHEFDFVMDSEDLTQAVSKGVTDKFADILNNNLEESISYTYNGEKITVNKNNTYQAVMEHMETNPSGAYIGNLAGADGDDKALLTALFEGALTFEVGNEEVPITVMVKQKNVYDTTASELVLYITADDLSESRAYVPVYSVVFTQNSDGKWIQVGDILEGEAQVIAYDGWEAILGIGSGSFNTETWRSTQAYYGVSTGSGIDAIMNGYEARNP